MGSAARRASRRRRSRHSDIERGPRRFQCQLTETRRELAGALRLLADWGSRGGAGGEPLTHAACGTLEDRWYCPTCGEAVEEAERDPR